MTRARPVSHRLLGRGHWSADEGIRTPDLLIANETRYQLRHSPEVRSNDNTSATGPRNRRTGPPARAETWPGSQRGPHHSPSDFPTRSSTADPPPIAGPGTRHDIPSPHATAPAPPPPRAAGPRRPPDHPAVPAAPRAIAVDRPAPPRPVVGAESGSAPRASGPGAAWSSSPRGRRLLPRACSPRSSSRSSSPSCSPPCSSRSTPRSPGSCPAGWPAGVTVFGTWPSSSGCCRSSAPSSRASSTT